MSAAKRFIALFDIHVGWENPMRRGVRERRVPTHAARAIKAAVRFAEDFAPDTLLLGGDQVNFGPISHWNKGRPILMEDLRLRDEYDELQKLVIDPLSGVGRKIWHDGNHEQWARDLVAESPGLEGLIEPEQYLQLSGPEGWEIYSQGEISNIGKLHFVHGDVLFRSYVSKQPALKLVQHYRRNIRAGHLHTWSVATDVTPIDSSDYHTGVIVPALSVKNPAYVKNAPTNHMQGFLYGYTWPDGSFNDQVVIINEDAFIVGGKKYHGR